MERLTPTLHGLEVAVVIPFDPAGDEHRARAFEFVRGNYAVRHPTWRIVSGAGDSGERWSKGAAVAGLLEQATAELLVIADADSFIADPHTLAEAVHLVAVRNAAWVVPHAKVYRLTEAATAEVYAGRRPRLGKTARPPYIGLAGGGIVVVRRSDFLRAGGFDPRFLGWGGEDLSLGWALETLVGHPTRLEGSLVHLWHPHPAPDLRGSAESEALVDEYRTARGRPRLMAALAERLPLPPPLELADPIRFRLTNRNTLRVAGQVLRFAGGVYETRDADLVDALRQHPNVREERRR